MHTDREACYRALKSRDRRFDGVFYTAVHTTGIYCRPSCPARTPAYQNVTFHPTAASAQCAGFRSCKRCLPDATPGSPDWDVDADVAGRAMRLIADGVVDREGVDGLASHIGFTARHLTRILTAELGAGPLALARARRAQTARVLIETTSMTFADVAFASGFSSVRQFNDTIREVYASSPTQLRSPRGGGAGGSLPERQRGRSRPGAADEHGGGAGGSLPERQRGRSRPGAANVYGQLTMRLAVRTPFAGRALLDFLAVRAVPGVETAGEDFYARTLSLPHGTGMVRLELVDDLEPGRIALVPATFRLEDLRDTAAAVERVRRLLDADCDPTAVDEHFSGDPVIGPLVRATPGLRVPGHVDGNEIAVRAVLGQQVSVAGARTIAARLVTAHGRPVTEQEEGLTHLFPDAATLARLDAEDLPMPRARGRALTGLCAALVDGSVALDRGPDRDDVRRRLLGLPGIGPWTADYIALRALGHPDVFLPTDVGVRNALARLGATPDTTDAWSPWRSYALLHLWHSLAPVAEPGNRTKEMI